MLNKVLKRAFVWFLAINLLLAQSTGFRLCASVPTPDVTEDLEFVTSENFVYDNEIGKSVNINLTKETTLKLSGLWEWGAVVFNCNFENVGENTAIKLFTDSGSLKKEGKKEDFENFTVNTFLGSPTFLISNNIDADNGKWQLNDDIWVNATVKGANKNVESKEMTLRTTSPVEMGKNDIIEFDYLFDSIGEDESVKFFVNDELKSQLDNNTTEKKGSFTIPSDGQYNFKWVQSSGKDSSSVSLENLKIKRAWQSGDTLSTKPVHLNRGDSIQFDSEFKLTKQNTFLCFLINGEENDRVSAREQEPRSFSYTAPKEGDYTFAWEYKEINDNEYDDDNYVNVWNIKLNRLASSEPVPDVIFTGVFSSWEKVGEEYVSGKDYDDSRLTTEAYLYEGDTINFEYMFDGDAEKCFGELFLDGKQARVYNYTKGNTWQKGNFVIPSTGNHKIEWSYNINNISEYNQSYPRMHLRNFSIDKKAVEVESKGHWYFTNPEASYRVYANVSLYGANKPFNLRAEPIDYFEAHKEVLPKISKWPAIESLGSIRLFASDESGNEFSNQDNEVQIRIHLAGAEFTDEEFKSIRNSLSLWQDDQGTVNKIEFYLGEDGSLIFNTGHLGVFTFALDADIREDDLGNDIEIEAKDSNLKMFFEAQKPGIFVNTINFYADTVMEEEEEEHKELLDGLDEEHKNNVENIVIHDIAAHDGLNHRIRYFHDLYDMYLERPEGWNDPNSYVLYINRTDKDEKFETDKYEDLATGITYLHIRTNHLSPYSIIDPINSNSSLSANTGDDTLMIMYFLICTNLAMGYVTYILKERSLKKMKK